MIVASKTDFERAIDILKEAAASQDYKNHAAANNVAFAIQQALDNYANFDEEHFYTLCVEQVPTAFDIAVENACNTDCMRYRQGTCQYIDKSTCSRVKTIYADLFDEDDE